MRFDKIIVWLLTTYRGGDLRALGPPPDIVTKLFGLRYLVFEPGLGLLVVDFVVLVMLRFPTKKLFG